jgi:pre-mRNA-processing factor 6
MVQGWIHQATNNYSAAARAAYAAGIKAAPKDITLWVPASRLDNADGKSIRARALAEKVRLVNPKSGILWTKAVRVEERSGALTHGKALLA